MTFVSYSDTITTVLTFLAVNPSVTATETGTFAYLIGANQFGWIQMQFCGLGGAITWLAAAFNETPGGTTGAGTFTATDPDDGPPAISETSNAGLTGLGALALGAVAVRRRCQQRKVTATCPETPAA